MNCLRLLFPATGGAALDASSSGEAEVEVEGDEPSPVDWDGLSWGVDAELFGEEGLLDRGESATGWPPSSPVPQIRYAPPASSRSSSGAATRGSRRRRRPDVSGGGAADPPRDGS